MDPSDVVDFGIFIGEENCPVGTVQCQKGCTYADIRSEILNDQVVQYPFEFIIGSPRCPLNAFQEERRKPTTTYVGIKRKVCTEVADTLESNVMEGTPISENIEGNVEEPMHKQPRVGNVSESVDQVVVDPNVLASWQHKVNRLMEEFVKEKLTLKVYLENGKPNIKIRCEICGIDYGTGEVSLAARTIRNFKNNHMKTGSHQRQISMLGINEMCEIPSGNKEKQTTVARDQLEIDQAIKLLHDFNQTQEPNLFKVVEATLANYEDKKKVRVECTRCNRWFSLVPASGNIVSSLNEHMKSKKHTTNTTVEASHDTVVLRSGTVGRPKKPTNEKSQQSLSKFLIPSLPSPSHGASTCPHPSTSGVEITQVLI